MLARTLQRPALKGISLRCSATPRFFSASRLAANSIAREGQVDYDAKYAEKLAQRAQQQGKTVGELRTQLKEQEKQRRLQSLQEQKVAASSVEQASAPTTHGSTNPPAKPSPVGTRKDSSPVKPLSNILNLDKLVETPHTAEQISALWRAYHETRSGGTGRGFLCATLPVETYEKMLAAATKYPTFVVPLPRPDAQVEEGSNQPAYEFYLMEWGFHGPPPDLAAARDLFAPPTPSTNPQTSTILFTPLQEYKLRASFATPYMVLTHYTDLAQSHGLVLLRGEITPSGADGAGARFMLSQQDAQLLAIHVQQFYLWNEGSDERVALLKAFHESPADFKWETLLKHADFSG